MAYRKILTISRTRR